MRGSYSLSGYVRDDDNRIVLPTAKLQVTYVSGTVAAPSVVTGTTGEFLFNGLGSGDYRVTATLNGYEPAFVDFRLGGTVLLTIEISMHKISTSSAIGGESISAHELTVPFNARDDYDKGVVLLVGSKPDYDKAIKQFQRAIKEFSTYYEAYAEMSIAYYHLENATAAEKALRTSVQMSKNQFPEALLLLAELLDNQTRFVEAEPIARQALGLQESWRAYFSLARALDGLQRPNDAELSALKASTLNPSDPEIFLVLGNIHIQQHKYAAVMKDFDQYLILEPSGSQSAAVRSTQEQIKKVLVRTQAVSN